MTLHCKTKSWSSHIGNQIRVCNLRNTFKQPVIADCSKKVTICLTIWLLTSQSFQYYHHNYLIQWPLTFPLHPIVRRLPQVFAPVPHHPTMQLWHNLKAPTIELTAHCDWATGCHRILSCNYDWRPWPGSHVANMAAHETRVPLIRTYILDQIRQFNCFVSTSMLKTRCFSNNKSSFMFLTLCKNITCMCNVHITNPLKLFTERQISIALIILGKQARYW